MNRVGLQVAEIKGPLQRDPFALRIASMVYLGLDVHPPRTLPACTPPKSASQGGSRSRRKTSALVIRLQNVPQQIYSRASPARSAEFQEGQIIG
eukprot:33653-Pelagomonas_calceolata.AAC.1